MTMNKQKLINKIVKIRLDNPDMSEPIDFKPNNIRARYYRYEMQDLDIKELEGILKELRED